MATNCRKKQWEREKNRERPEGKQMWCSCRRAKSKALIQTLCWVKCHLFIRAERPDLLSLCRPRNMIHNVLALRGHKLCVSGGMRLFQKSLWTNQPISCLFFLWNNSITCDKTAYENYWNSAVVVTCRPNSLLKSLWFFHICTARPKCFKHHPGSYSTHVWYAGFLVCLIKLVSE